MRECILIGKKFHLIKTSLRVRCGKIYDVTSPIKSIEWTDRDLCATCRAYWNV